MIRKSSHSRKQEVKVASYKKKTGARSWHYQLEVKRINSRRQSYASVDVFNNFSDSFRVSFVARMGASAWSGQKIFSAENNVACQLASVSALALFKCVLTIFNKLDCGVARKLSCRKNRGREMKKVLTWAICSLENVVSLPINCPVENDFGA